MSRQRRSAVAGAPAFSHWCPAPGLAVIERLVRLLKIMPAGVAPAFDCKGALGRLKTSLRCAPALRGLDPPSASPRSGNYRSEPTMNFGQPRESQRNGEDPRFQPASSCGRAHDASCGCRHHGGGFSERPERPRWTLRLTIYAVAALSSYSAYASRTRSRMRSWAAVSAIGRSSVKLRLSPLTEY